MLKQKKREWLYLLSSVIELGSTDAEAENYSLLWNETENKFVVQRRQTYLTTR